jgi:cytochrome c oxidase subunit 1
MFGRLMHEGLGKVHFWLTFVAYYCTFFPMHYIGVGGHMRRLYDPYQYQFLESYQGINQFITISAFVLGSAQFIFIANFFWSAFKGKKASENPWNATGIEWTTPSPPGHGNWAGDIPEVHRWPFDYAVPGAPEDYVMQTDPAPIGERAESHGS